MRLFDLGDTGVLAEVDSPADVLGLLAALRADREAGRCPVVEDLVPAERTLLVRFDPRAADPAAVRAWVGATRPVPATGSTAERVEMRVGTTGPTCRTSGG